MATLGTTDDGRVTVDIDRLIASRLLIQANSGAGKSWTLRRLLEITHGRVQHIVIDPEGEFHTLRERFDYVLAAHQGGDCLADPKTAKLLARRLLELSVSAIVDIYELKAHERVRFVRLFLEEMVNAPRALWHPALVIIDEAHVFCPQTGQAESAGAVIDLMTRGRKRGFCGVLATQRISKLHKDAAAEANNKLIGRSSLDVDMKRAGDEIGFHGRDQQHELRSLRAGEFFAFGPAISEQIVRMKVGSLVTKHPEAGAVAPPPTPPSDKVKTALAKLSDLPREAEEEAQTITVLSRKVRDQQAQIRCLEKATPTLDEAAVARRVEEAVRKAEAVAVERHATATAAVAAEIGNMLDQMRRKVDKICAPAPSPARRPAAAPKPNGRHSPTSDVPPSQRRVLNAVAWWASILVDRPTRAQVAFVAGYSPNSGGFANLLGQLRTADLIDYPDRGAVALTDAGDAIASGPDTPATTEALHDLVRNNLKVPQRRVLDAVLAAWPNPITPADLAGATGYSETSGGFANLLGSLRTLGMVDYPSRGKVRATDVLFV